MKLHILTLLKKVAGGHVSAIDALWEMSLQHRDLVPRLWKAAVEGGLPAVSDLVGRAGVNREGKNAALIAAAAAGQLFIARILLDSKANPDARGGGALCEAVKNGDLPFVRMLLDFGAKVDVSGAAVWDYAASAGSVDMLRLLSNDGRRIPVSREWLTTRAATYGNAPVVGWLLDLANPAGFEEKGLWAAAADHLQVLEVMLERLATPSVQTMDQVVVKAVDAGKMGVVNWALENGATTLERSVDPLVQALLHGRLEMAEFLVMKGASPRALEKKVKLRSVSKDFWNALLAMEEQMLLAASVQPPEKSGIAVPRM